MSNIDIKKYVLPNLPYLFIFWFFSKVAEGYRLSASTDIVARAMDALSGLEAVISQNPLPSFHPAICSLESSVCLLSAPLSILRARTRKSTVMA